MIRVWLFVLFIIAYVLYMMMFTNIWMIVSKLIDLQHLNCACGVFDRGDVRRVRVVFECEIQLNHIDKTLINCEI